MLRLSSLGVLWLLSISCTGRHLNLAATKPDKKSDLEIASQTQNNRVESSEHNEGAALQPPPPPAIETPTSLNESVYQMPNGASVKIRLRPGALYEELILRDTQARSILNLELLKLWVETMAHDSGLQLQSSEREEQESNQPAGTHFVSGIDSAINADSTSTGLAFLGKLKQPTRDSFQRAVARKEELDNQRRTQAKEILLMNLRQQLGFEQKRIVRYELFACELEKWLRESVVLWDFPLQGRAMKGQTAQLQTLSSELVKLTAKSQNSRACVLDDEIFKLRKTWSEIESPKLRSRTLKPQAGTGSLLLLVMPAKQDAEIEKHFQQWLKVASLTVEREPTQHQLHWISGDVEALKAAYTDLQLMLSKTSQQRGIVLLAVEKPDQLHRLP